MQATGNNPLHNYSLSIRISADGFSFIETDASTGTLWKRRDFVLREGENLAQKVEEVLGTISDQLFVSVRLVSTAPSTRIPLEEFRRDDLVALYRVVYPDVDLQQMDLCYSVLPQLEVVELFPVSRDLRKVVSRTFSTVTCEHECGVMLEQMITDYRQRSLRCRTLYAHIADAQLLLCHINDGRLVFANSYPAQQIPDALYFLLYAWKTLSLDANTDVCILSGDDQVAHQLQSQCAIYLQNIIMK